MLEKLSLGTKVKVKVEAFDCDAFPVYGGGYEGSHRNYIYEGIVTKIIDDETIEVFIRQSQDSDDDITLLFKLSLADKYSTELNISRTWYWYSDESNYDSIFISEILDTPPYTGGGLELHQQVIVEVCQYEPEEETGYCTTEYKGLVTKVIDPETVEVFVQRFEYEGEDDYRYFTFELSPATTAQPTRVWLSEDYGYLLSTIKTNCSTT